MTGTVERATGQMLPLARRIIQLELGIWLSLYRFLFRRPRVPAGATAFTYHRPIHTILVVFIVLSAFEIPIIDLVVHRWPVVRVVILVLGIWGLTWMLGYLLGFVTRPHAVGPEGISVRNGAEVDIPLSWDDVRSVELTTVVAESGKAPKLTDDGSGRILHLRIQNETNVEVLLERPVSVRLPHGTTTVNGVRFHVDEPRQFLDEVRREIG